MVLANWIDWYITLEAWEPKKRGMCAGNVPARHAHEMIFTHGRTATI